MTQDLRNLLKEARTIIRCHARHFAKDWDERTTKALADTPPQRQPLSDEEIMAMVQDKCVDMRWPSTALSIARAIEAAHGIKGDT